MPEENFLGYAEVDPGGDIERTAERVTWTTMERNRVSHVSLDKGVGFFDGDFEHLLTVRITYSTGTAGDKGAVWLIANAVTNFRDFVYLGTQPGLAIGFRHDSGGWKLMIWEISGGTVYSGPGGCPGESHACYIIGSGIYYLKLVRDEAIGTFGRFTCRIYSDPARQNLLHTLHIDLHSKQDFRYIIPLTNYKTAASGFEWSGYVEDLNLAPIYLSTVTTDPATAVLPTRAALNGTLDADGGEACDCGFEWGETIAYSNITPTQSKTTGETFSQFISGLDPGTTYHVRAFATNSLGTSYGADRTFTTQELLIINRSYALAREEL
ncbi:hypothetical protein ES703_116089 [subsurface metagenome]